MDKTSNADQPEPLAPRPTLSIAAVERDTGLSKDTLRVWERRYGFPMPQRDDHGERSYSPSDLERLRLLKRLLDAGHRPGRLVALPVEQLRERVELPRAATPDLPRPAGLAGPAGLQELLALIGREAPSTFRARLLALLSRQGLARFVVEVIAPLNQQVGEAWFRGEIEVYQEHLYTEAVQSVLRPAIAAVPEPADAAATRVLLTTVPDEPHALGLLMAEALFALEGCRCHSLGVQTPLDDIVAAARAQQVDIVALSFSTCLKVRQVEQSLVELRRRLPRSVRLWAGGKSAALRRRAIDGVEVLDSLPAIAERLALPADPRPQR